MASPILLRSVKTNNHKRATNLHIFDIVFYTVFVDLRSRQKCHKGSTVRCTCANQMQNNCAWKDSHASLNLNAIQECQQRHDNIRVKKRDETIYVYKSVCVVLVR